jgi:hypothetical protein
MRDLILEQVELQDNTLDDNTFDVFFDTNTKQFHCFENDVEEDEEIREFVYILTEDLQTIIKNNREEILSYVISQPNIQHEVTLGDIFLHGKFIKRIL